LDDFIEERRVNLHRFFDWRQLGFACATLAGVREMVCTDAVFLTTVLADSYQRHSFTPLHWIHIADFGCVASVPSLVVTESALYISVLQSVRGFFPKVW
jgi:hypothetical protein